MAQQERRRMVLAARNNFPELPVKMAVVVDNEGDIRVLYLAGEMVSNWTPMYRFGLARFMVMHMGYKVDLNNTWESLERDLRDASYAYYKFRNPTNIVNK